jgi:hypothetical protein
VHDTCIERLRDLDSRMTAEQKKQAEEKLRQERLAAVQKIMAEAARRRAAVPLVNPHYTAQGTLARSPDVPGVPGTHRLVLDGTVLYYLRSSVGGLDLDRFVGQQIGVMGHKRLVPGWGTEVIDVVDVGLLGPAPAGRAPEPEAVE